MWGARTRAVGIAAAVLLMCSLLGCTEKTADTPPYTLDDSMKLTMLDEITAASAPTGLPGAAGFVYSVGPAGQSGSLEYQVLDSGERSEWITGLYPSLCVDGLYYYDHGTLKFITGPDERPVEISVSGYERVVASPGNRWLVLISSSTGTSTGRLALNDRQAGQTIPLAWTGEHDARNPSWADDERLLCDASAPEGADADRAVYELYVDDDGLLRTSVLKLAATQPAENGSGWLACLEPAGTGSERILAVYDLNERTRLAWVGQAQAQSTFGDIVWVTDDILAVEVNTKDVGTNIVLYQLEGS